MGESTLDRKYEQAASVICRQGMVPIPANETTIAILKLVIEDNEEELDFIQEFGEKASQTMDQLKASSGLSEEKIEALAMGLARKGLFFNQPNSSGIMVSCAA